jgi:hypothetical protein
MSATDPQLATVVAANINRAARAEGRMQHYDLVLDVVDPDGTVVRHELTAVAMGTMLPMVGSAVRVRAGDGGRVEVLWRGDPNLDLDAHRAQLAQLAERARGRRADAGGG